MVKFDSIGSVRCRVGEGPTWVAAEHRLWWVGLQEGAWYSQDWPSGGERTEPLGDRVSFVIPHGDTRRIAALGKEIVALRGSTATRLALVEDGVEDTFINDGKVGPDGRLYFGTFDRRRRDGLCGLYRLDVDGPAVRVADDLVIGNGLGWSPDEITMYVVDSHRRHVLAFDFDREDGAVSGRRVLIDVPQCDGMPDGLTVAADGTIWVALYGGGAIHRYAADGRLLTSITVPVEFPTSCAFAGPDLTKLVVTTSFARIADAGGTLGPLDGAVLVADVGAVGLPLAEFGGAT